MKASLPVFFESILYYKGHFPLMHLHLQRMKELVNFLGVDSSISELYFEKILRESLTLEAEQKLKVKFQVQEKKLIVASIDSENIYPHSFNQYPAIGLTVFPYYHKSCDSYALWKYENPHIYKYSINYAQENNASQSIILNETGDIIETSLSNIFYIINDKVYTPPLHAGAVNGVFRRYLMSIMKIEERILKLNEIMKIQECFITSAIRGIVAVKRIDKNQYSTERTENAIKKLIHLS